MVDYGVYFNETAKKDYSFRVKEETVTVSDENEAGKKILSVVKMLVKAGFKGLKLFFTITEKGIKIIFKVIDDGAEFIIYGLETILENLSNKARDRILKVMLYGAIILTIANGIDKMNMRHRIEELEDSNQQVVMSLDENDVENKTGTENSAEVSSVDSRASKAMALKTLKADNDFVGNIAFSSAIQNDADAHKPINSTVRYLENGEVKVEKTVTYGYGAFTSTKGNRDVKDFLKYIKAVDKDFYDEYFDEVGQPTTTTFNTGWYTASKTENEKFKKLQFEYLYKKYTEPTINAVSQELSVNLKSSKALHEFAFSTSVEYGKKGTLMLFENAGVKPNMNAKQIISLVQQEKVRSLGDYTYTDNWKYTDSDRTAVKKRVEKETKEFLDLLN